MRLTGHEVSTILAALRCWQKNGCNTNQDIATNEGEFPLMPADDVDDLCERMNCTGTLPEEKVSSVMVSACDGCIDDIVEAALNHVKRRCDNGWQDTSTRSMDDEKLHARIQASLASATEYLNLGEWLACLMEASHAMLLLGRLFGNQNHRALVRPGD